MIANDESPPSEEVMRQIRHKQFNKMNEKEAKCLSHYKKTSWYEDMRARAITLNKEIETEFLAGFVESIRDVPFFEIILVRKEQLDCIRSVKKEERILHFDATGNIISVPDG